jgi:sporulation protein YlmC with PRC-barrel domain
MNRLLATTAVGLLLGLTPALAQDAAEQPQTPPAMQDPGQPSEALPSMPSEPAAPIPGDEANPQAAPDKSSEMMPSAPDPSAADETSPPAQSTQAPESAPPSAQSTEAPESIIPAKPSESAAAGPKFLSKQESSDMLASSLIGQSVVNSQDESIGDINDLVTDESGKVIAVLVGTGGFLGLGEKDVALGFEDLRFARDENNAIKVIANVTKETLASAPDYETLAEQQVTVGENKGDREDRPE